MKLEVVQAALNVLSSFVNRTAPMAAEVELLRQALGPAAAGQGADELARMVIDRYLQESKHKRCAAG